MRSQDWPNLQPPPAVWFGESTRGYRTGDAVFSHRCGMGAPAVAITVRILKDYKMQNTKLGHTILSAAIISDTVILIVFSLFLQLVEVGSIDPLSALIMLVKITLFFAAVIFGGMKTQKYS